MACGARLGLKRLVLGRGLLGGQSRNGLWSPFGIETFRPTTVALVEGEKETSPPRSLKKTQPLPQMGLQRRCCLLQHRHRQVLRRTQTQVVTVIADRKSTRLNSSHSQISYAVFCLKKKREFATAIKNARMMAMVWSTRSGCY